MRVKSLLNYDLAASFLYFPPVFKRQLEKPQSVLDLREGKRHGQSFGQTVSSLSIQNHTTLYYAAICDDQT